MLALFVWLIFSFIVISPAVAQDEGIRGVAVGGGEWADEFGRGNTHFNLRGNFTGNANGGHLLVSLQDGNYFLVKAEPDSVVFLDGDWPYIDAAGDEGIVSGYAMWAIGKVVNTSPDFDDLRGTWCLMGAYDGGKSSHSRDFLNAFPGNDEGDVWDFYDMALNGEFPLWAEMVKGNTTLNVQD